MTRYVTCVEARFAVAFGDAHTGVADAEDALPGQRSGAGIERGGAIADGVVIELLAVHGDDQIVCGERPAAPDQISLSGAICSVSHTTLPLAAS